MKIAVVWNQPKFLVVLLIGRRSDAISPGLEKSEWMFGVKSEIIRNQPRQSRHQGQPGQVHTQYLAVELL